MHTETLGLDIRLSQSSVRSAPYRLIDTSDISHLPAFYYFWLNYTVPALMQQTALSFIVRLSFFVSLTSSTYSL